MRRITTAVLGALGLVVAAASAASAADSITGPVTGLAVNPIITATDLITATNILNNLLPTGLL
ncbi:hypothetical protein [Streptomyces sp. NRRL S-87]|uniref:hypothetical protein n=1 Tax=Streptomyces sp. NRRL S-87 TaxID=1463920 RepID=UPI0004BEAA41|nr:hypothetical protein [Streptomyces sp. NRRL S-87]